MDETKKACLPLALALGLMIAAGRVPPLAGHAADAETAGQARPLSPGGLAPGTILSRRGAPAVGDDSARPEAGGLTLEQCIAEALARNPLWLSSEQEYQAALARVRQARALAQPSLDFDSDLQPGLLDFRGSGEGYLGLSQTLEFPGKRSVRGRIARAESREILADRDLLRLDLAFQVSEAFSTVLLAEEKLKYAHQDLDLANDFRAQAELKVSLGDAARVEALRAGVEAVKTAAAVRMAENDVRLSKARLNFLLGRGRSAPLEIRGILKQVGQPLEVDPLVARALVVRPEIRRINVSLEREGLRTREAWLSYLPDFNLGLARHRLAGERTTWNVTLSFPIPLFFWQPATGPAAEAEANRRALAKEAENLRNSISLEVEQACLSAETARHQIELFEKDILAQAEEVYALMLFSYKEGEIGGLELIEARRSLLEARKAYADALYARSLTLATLVRAVGAPLEGGGTPAEPGSLEGDHHDKK